MAARAILLDALGTLVTLEDPVAELVTQLRERHAIEVAPPLAAAALRAEMAHYRAHCLRAGGAASLHALRLECAALLGRELGGEAARLTPADLLPALLGSLRFTAFPDVLPALERWRRAGVTLVVASNWDVSLHDVLRECGVREHLDGVVTSAQVGVAKPAPALFEAALTLAGVAAREATHVGDSYAADVDGARAAGIEPVWLRRGAGPAEPDAPPGLRVITTLADL
jgi:putative hydrolase of the HAD superfamily